jgi:hypothetical protein
MTIAGTLANNNTTVTVGIQSIVLNGGTINGTANGLTNVTGTLTVSAATTGTIGRVALTVVGATTIPATATLLINDTNGTKSFADVTITGTWNNSANEDITITGDFTNNGTFTSGTGAYTLTGTKALSGTAVNTTFSGNVVITNTRTNNTTVTINGTLDGSAAGSTWTQANGSTLNYANATQPMATGTLNASTCTNTVNFSLNGNQDIEGATYCNLTTSTGGTKTLQSAATTVNGILTIGTLTTLEAGGQNLTVNGTTNITGTFNKNANTNVSSFVGLVTVNVGGIWATTSSTTSTNLLFSGGLTNNGTFNAGGVNFNATQTIAGNSAISFANSTRIVGAFSVTNNNTSTITVTGVLDGNVAGSTWIQGAGSTLNYANGTQPMNTAGVLNASTCTNTVNYTLAGAQGVRGTTYCNLTITGDNTKTLQGATTVTGILAITNTLINTAPTLELDIQNFTVSGTTVITGTAVANYGNYATGNGAFLNDANATGTNTFTGLVTMDINGSWNTNTAGVNVTFGGGILNKGRDFNTNTVVFNATQSLTGGSITNFNGNVTINSGVTVTNGSLVPNSGGFIRASGTVEGATGTASWINIGSLKYNNTNPLMSVGTFTATDDYNSVDYICACTQTVKDIHYYNLLVTNSTKTMNPTTTRNVNGMLTVRNTTFTVNTIELEVKLATIGTNATFNNATTAVAGTTTNFNQNSAFTGKFNTISASNDNDSYAYSNNGSDVVLQRGTAGGVYAVKTTNFTTAPTQFVAQFEFETKSKFTDSNAATILLGDAFTNDLTRNASTARLQFNFDATNNQYSITHPDGTLTTSALQSSRQTVTWVVNNAAGLYNYTDPLGVTNSVASGNVDVWIGTTQFVNEVGMANFGTPVNDIKIVYDAGTASGSFIEKQNITVSNLRFYLTPPTNISGVINRYTSVSAINGAKTQLTVASNTGFVAGNRVMVIQMKNATIDNTDAATYGNITSYNNAGRYELARVASVSGGTIVNLTASLVGTYDAGVANAAVQLIYVPEYGNVTVDGLLTAQAWNPTTQTGGVLALAATGTVTLQADVDVTGLGFKGGNIIGNDGSCRVGIYRNSDTNYGGKGEGITTDTNTRGRGKLANGGGGGNPHNSGGGGGGNFGKGANGARQWNCAGGGDVNNDCVDPVGLTPPDTEQNSGVGGAVLDYTTGRIFLGGGGGSGQQNNDVGTSGANGGGIIVMLADAISGNGFLMSAKGASVLATAGNDAGGGGGGGGAIFLDTKNFGTTLRVNVQGGKGGDVDFASCHGNGGGGGGGVLRLQVDPTPSNVTVVKGGGPSSRNADNSDCALTANSFFCAEATGTGGVIFNNITILPVTITSFDARKIENKQSLLEWTTTQEVNNKQIEIERSKDGINFTKIYVMIPKGNKTSMTNYTWIDANPLAGINYYRLKFVDYDSKFTHSQIKALHFDENAALLAELYPNPASKNGFFISLRENATETEKLIVAVYDMLGRKVETKVEKTEKGLFQITPQQTNLPTGMYVVEIFGNNFRTTKKVMIE